MIMMNLKYYLRGLGIGIVVTALIMGITSGGKEKLSNAEIRERAKALGMVEDDTEGGTLLEIGSASQTEADNMAANQPAASQPTGNRPADRDNQLEEQENEIQEPDAMDGEGSDEQDKPEDVEPSADPETLPGGDEMPEEPEETPKAVTTPDEREADSEIPAENEPEETPEPVEESRPATGSVTLQIARGDGSYAVCKRLEEAGLIESATEYDLFLYQNGYDKKIRAGTFEIPADTSGEKIAKIITGIE